MIIFPFQYITLLNARILRILNPVFDIESLVLNFWKMKKDFLIKLLAIEGEGIKDTCFFSMVKFFGDFNVVVEISH